MHRAVVGATQRECMTGICVLGDQCWRQVSIETLVEMKLWSSFASLFRVVRYARHVGVGRNRRKLNASSCWTMVSIAAAAHTRKRKSKGTCVAHSRSVNQ